MLMTDAAGVFVLIADPQEAQWLATVRFLT